MPIKAGFDEFGCQKVVKFDNGWALSIVSDGGNLKYDTEDTWEVGIVGPDGKLNYGSSHPYDGVVGFCDIWTIVKIAEEIKVIPEGVCYE